MPGFFSRVFGGKDGVRTSSSPSSGINEATPSKLQWKDAWLRTEVGPEEVQRLVHSCTLEVKSRALTLPFLLLPFRPSSDASAAKMFVRNYFGSVTGTGTYFSEEELQRALRLTEPMVLCSVLKWCWSRLPGGVVTWEAYELFRIGEQDSNMARDAFATFLPLSVDSDARLKIIFDFFDLLAAIAAYGKNNGFGGRKLSRLAGWWAFDQSDQGDGFDGGYRSWARAADATSHLFFAYLRSLSQATPGTDSILTLPRSLQALVQATEYPPQTPVLLQHTTAKLVMIVDAVSPTPFALLRRAKQFEYRDDDRALLAFAAFEDPVQALTEECRRVLTCISSTNQSASSTSKSGNATQEAAWSRFEDMGFSTLMEEPERAPLRHQASFGGLSSSARSPAMDMGRPTTPSWADFLSVGFDQTPGKDRPPYLLPPDKALPPIDASRTNSLHSALRDGDETSLAPGELASITVIHLDDSFWWVWITSLAGEEPPERKAVFGRCAVIETDIPGGRWLVVEEKVKGAAPEPEEGAHIVVKKSRFGITRRGRGISWRGKTAGSKKASSPAPESPYGGKRTAAVTTKSATSTSLDQHARIQAAAAALQQKQRNQRGDDQTAAMRRARTEDVLTTNTNSVFTLQPMFLSEAAPALKWAHKFDKDSLREAYLGNNAPGKDSPDVVLHANGEAGVNGVLKKEDSTLPSKGAAKERDLPALPQGGELPRPPPVHALSDGAAYQSTVTALHAAESEPMKVAARQPREPPLPVDNKPSPQVQPVEQPTTGYFSPDPIMAEEIPMKESLVETPVEDQTAGKNPHRRAVGGGGFKKLFGMKNADRQPSQTPPVELKPMDVPEAKPSGLSRRFSLRSKSSLMVQQITTEPTPEEPTKDVHVKPALRAAASVDSFVLISGTQSANTSEVRPPAPENSTGPSPTSHSPAPENHTSFQHGPLEDVPEFVPADTPDDGSSDHPVSPIAVEDPEPRMNGDESVSEKSLELSPSGPSQAIDRWAQIRKNAAERVAAKASESQTRLHRTDDGETSGEETIESRVARIKARVAELTGNLDESNTLRASQR